MSFFLGDTAQFSNVGVNPEKVKLAKIQFDAMSTTFNKVLQSCHKKCIAHEYGEGELNTGEASCLDRCVAKYVKANTLVGQSMKYNLVPEKMPEYQEVAARLVGSVNNNQ
ncbi:hypothetical protein FT662_05076 [Candidozyma haemuli var. vulneris]|uniref:Mitochondrial import inner membrane translocase subunit n=1 Tax=Candidozyma haemuli TaxID=45357 RepID=A0A2V1AV24_9ASCO|nr:hypothetical protein CXQ85_000604 [[Candida] haemuloni]KAF3985561.1 hypothetical protein FT662_05076 [[Candida] haemuloni var. vulneris]PVH21622.1 hypothetical protein CXQ85_000604 [[Candida] haemuloni]